jgi:hypothetical protein
MVSLSGPDCDGQRRAKIIQWQRTRPLPQSGDAVRAQSCGNALPKMVVLCTLVGIQLCVDRRAYNVGARQQLRCSYPAPMSGCQASPQL